MSPGGEPDLEPGEVPMEPGQEEEKLENLSADELWTKITSAVESGDSASFNKMQTFLINSDIENKEYMYVDAWYAWGSVTNDKNNFAAAIYELVEGDKKVHFDILNNAAWYFYLLLEGPGEMMIAADWAKQSIDIQPTHYNHDTYAHILYRQGKRDKAPLARCSSNKAGGSSRCGCKGF